MDEKNEIFILKRHPFMDGLKNKPEKKEKEVKKIRNWMSTQPHLPVISDDYIYLFLHSCHYEVEVTKHTIETYFTLRANTPSIFSNRNVYSDQIQTVLKLGYLVRLPQCTPEGYKVLLYCVKDSDVSKFNFADAVRGFCMFNDCILSEDGLAEGYVVIFDMNGVRLGHIARVSLPALRAFMLYIQEGHPARLKAIHCLNTANYINHVMRLISPLIRNELFGLLKFHTGKVPEGIPLEILPKEYGGEGPSIDVLDAECHNLVEKYADWLTETERFKADESQRPKKASWWSIFSGGGGNPNNLGLINKENDVPVEFD